MWSGFVLNPQTFPFPASGEGLDSRCHPRGHLSGYLCSYNTTWISAAATIQGGSLLQLQYNPREAEMQQSYDWKLWHLWFPGLGGCYIAVGQSGRNVNASGTSSPLLHLLVSQQLLTWWPSIYAISIQMIQRAKVIWTG